MLEQAASVSQIIQSIAIAIALVIGGVWTLFWHRRLREERLSIDFSVSIQTSASYMHGMSIVSLVFLMKNAGSRDLRLAPEPEPPASFAEPFFVKNPNTPYEKPAYRNCEIRLWRLTVPDNPPTTLIRLRDRSRAVEIPLADEPVNILAENNITPNSFWLEPGEVVHIATNFSLPPGYYAGRIQTLFNFPSLLSKTKHEKKYTFDTFTFAFEVAPEEHEI